MKRLLMTAGLLVCALTAAHAQSLGDRLRSVGPGTQPITLPVGCGEALKVNCARVLSRIGFNTAAAGVTLTPQTSTGSVQSLDGICAGLIPSAIVQRDAADFRARKSDCVGKYDVVGAPLYPYYGFMAVRASEPAGSLAALVNNIPNGKVLTIAVGDAGSGGEITMSNMLASAPSWKHAVNMVNYGLETALGRIREGSVNGFFFMDGRDSDLVEKVDSAVDGKGKHLFKFLDIRPPGKFWRIKDWQGGCLYQQETLIDGTFSSTKTVSVSGVMVLSNAYREKQPVGPRVHDILSDAIDRAASAILVQDTKSPRDWTPPTSCD